VDGWISGLIEFIEANRDATFWIALFFAFGETIALISIIIPSTAILVGVGALVATGAIDFLPLWAGATVGAICGSIFSWWLGRIVGEPVLAAWPLSKYPENTAKGVDAFRRWGPAAVFIGHFFGPLRSVVFLLAGITGVGLVRFLVVTIPGAIGWAYVVPKFGEVSGLIIGWLWRVLGF
jgi:membrane protein DedA with SNARE-associated domain